MRAALFIALIISSVGVFAGDRFHNTVGLTWGLTQASEYEGPKTESASAGVRVSLSPFEWLYLGSEANAEAFNTDMYLSNDDADGSIVSGIGFFGVERRLDGGSTGLQVQVNYQYSESEIKSHGSSGTITRKESSEGVRVGTAYFVDMDDRLRLSFGAEAGVYGDFPGDDGLVGTSIRFTALRGIFIEGDIKVNPDTLRLGGQFGYRF